MKEIIKIVKFTFISLSAGLIEIGLFSLLNEFTNFSYWPCYLIALTTSVLWNFTFNRKYTFSSSSNVPLAMVKVFCYYLVFTPISAYFGNVLVNKGINEYIVTMINMTINFITEYLYQRNFVFKK